MIKGAIAICTFWSGVSSIFFILVSQILSADFQPKHYSIFTMKLILSIVTCLMLTSASYGQQATDPAQDPTALGNAFFKAMLDEDGSAMTKLLASDFSITSFNGQAVDGDLLVQGVSGGYVVVESATVSGTQTRQYNSDAAVMTGTWKAKGNIQGQGFDNSVAFSLVSAKQGGSWKIVNVQFTPVQP